MWAIELCGTVLHVLRFPFGQKRRLSLSSLHALETDSPSAKKSVASLLDGGCMIFVSSFLLHFPPLYILNLHPQYTPSNDPPYGPELSPPCGFSAWYLLWLSPIDMAQMHLG